MGTPVPGPHWNGWPRPPISLEPCPLQEPPPTPARRSVRACWAAVPQSRSRDGRVLRRADRDVSVARAASLQSASGNMVGHCARRRGQSRGSGSTELVDETDERVLAAVRRRKAQEKFRDELLHAYSGRCAVTGYDAAQALQGAHILAYSGRSSQQVRNGVLLRADVHLLFDHHLLGISPDELTIHLAPRIARSSYAELEGRTLRPTALSRQGPSRERLAVHWAVFARAASNA